MNQPLDIQPTTPSFNTPSIELKEIQPDKFHSIKDLNNQKRKLIYRKLLHYDNEQLSLEEMKMNTQINKYEYYSLVHKYYTLSCKKVKEFSKITSEGYSLYLLKALNNNKIFDSIKGYDKQDIKLLEKIDMDLARVTNTFCSKNLPILASIRRIAFIIAKTEYNCPYTQGLIDIIIPLYQIFNEEFIGEVKSNEISDVECNVYRVVCYIYKKLNLWYYPKLKDGAIMATTLYGRLLELIDTDLYNYLSQINAHPMFYAFEPIITLFSRILPIDDLTILLDHVFVSKKFSFLLCFMAEIILENKDKLLLIQSEDEAMLFLMKVFPLSCFNEVLANARSLYLKYENSINEIFKTTKQSSL
ncbi:hypothetical protein EHI8A_124100 [Entamoeba histolytica HM-1:IMSS-B]|uniref:Rab-GAP TBC domain-containing protein n=6 Tax=Entamoeba histolytica TaxID=5759 RepID=B1N599_ENTH1|nr:hypothetical protein EHI_182050 [Entamoeba histolytica HM-1:IMSS]EMD45696.1 Hypothetical protein EHI5A_137860 [Entamoeba histolytica KU27]EMH77047.1 hypothetical protein EHI8A_124100 [Entamoeba histolytica HM-1:IMSS-B]EMS14703.1 hypothetical protein KM1_165710 [Entamoeba histolytica HM-3:IMSS]ENY62350.1 hypothetical protein EHI7A_088580 [Entamoeba histolytica HM-1:IMSS-A]GAT99351.1 hypothetical protein CL6EHI_182050 [Entamoeba histolytica]|eukprot:XP_001914365.1 hypothetical protein EHI_182050 [Entamoeba histolytica HM-1:IMSS]